MLGTRGLTETPNEQKLTVPGMAFWADTGPFGTTCGNCRHKGYRRKVVSKAGEFVKMRPSQGCAKYWELTGIHGPAFDNRIPSCRYYEARES